MARGDWTCPPVNDKGVKRLYNAIPNPGGGGGYQKKLVRKGSAPRSGPTPYPLYTIFDRKDTLSYTFHWKIVPLSHIN